MLLYMRVKSLRPKQSHIRPLKLHIKTDYNIFFPQIEIPQCLCSLLNFYTTKELNYLYNLLVSVKPVRLIWKHLVKKHLSDSPSCPSYSGLKSTHPWFCYPMHPRFSKEELTHLFLLSPRVCRSRLTCMLLLFFIRVCHSALPLNITTVILA